MPRYGEWHESWAGYSGIKWPCDPFRLDGAKKSGAFRTELDAGQVEEIKVTPYGMSETNEMADPVAIGVGGVNSDAHKANVKISVTPVLPGFAVPIQLINGHGHETDREAQLDLGGGIIARGGGPPVLGFADSLGTIHGVLRSSDVVTGSGFTTPDCILKAGTMEKTVRFNWDNFRETNQWTHSPAYLPVPGVLLNTVTFRHHRLGPGAEDPWKPFDGHDIRFFVTKAELRDGTSELNDPPWDDGLTNYATFSLDPFTTDGNGRVTDVPLTTKEACTNLSRLTIAAYDWTVWKEPATPLATFALKVLGATALPSSTPDSTKHVTQNTNNAVLKVDIEVKDTADEDDDVVCRYSTDPAGRPTIPCRARIQGLGSGSATVVLTGGKVRFSGESDTTKTLSLPGDGSWVSFSISGQTESTAKNDAVIDAHLDTASGCVCGSEDLTVLWVKNTALRNTQDAAFSADNASALKPNPAKLGKQQLVPPPTEPTLAHVVEIVADVFPSDFDQDVEFTRDKTDEFTAGQLPPNAPVIVTNNTGIPRGVGSGNDPTDPGWHDEDPQPNGRIYDIDTPGHRTGDGDDVPERNNPQGSYLYLRMNFLQYAMYNGIRCSDDFAWYVRLTSKKLSPPGTGTFIHYSRPDHPTDNAAGPGSTNMSVD